MVDRGKIKSGSSREQSLRIELGQEVYGAFAGGNGFFHRRGNVERLEENRFCVDFGSFSYAYAMEDIGKLVFLDEKQAENTAEERQNRQYETEREEFDAKTLFSDR